jgi:rfaE bifunctional protein kinase chain/domain
VPVVRKQRTTLQPGGAGNTAANLAALGARVSLFGVTGRDSHAGELKAALQAHGVETTGLIADAGRPTTTKTRVIAAHQQVVRIDEEATGPISEAIASDVLKAVRNELTNAGAVVISDYAKGFLTPPLLDAVIGEARRLGKRVFADPKGADAARYRGAFLLKPNRLELGLLTGLPADTHAEVLAAGSRLAASMPGTHILVTEGSEGMTLFSANQPPEHLASRRHRRGRYRTRRGRHGRDRGRFLEPSDAACWRSCGHCHRADGQRRRRLGIFEILGDSARLIQRAENNPAACTRAVEWCSANESQSASTSRHRRFSRRPNGVGNPDAAG